MKVISESERIYLRELIPKDAKVFFELNEDPEVLKYTGDLPFKNIDDARNFLKNYKEYENFGFGRWAFIRKEDDAFLGWCGLKFNEDEEIDLGFRLFKKYWGKGGYAGEAAAMSLEYAWKELKLKRIVARVAEGNTASKKLVEKLGFKLKKRSTCQGIENALYYDIIN